LGWSFAEHPPYHAVVANSGARAAHPAFFERFKGLVLTMVSPPGAPEMDTVAYPILANQFRDWLKLRQTELMLTLYSSEVASKHYSQHDLIDRRFKLRRWPASSLLLGDPVRLRIATLMSRNALSSAQLAQMTGQPEESCRLFLVLLQGADLLVEVTAIEVAGGAAPAAGATRGGGAGTAHAAADDAKVKVGLMASIRRRLGL